MSLSTVSTNVVLTTLLGASSTSLGQVVLMDQIGADDGSSIDAGNILPNQIFEAGFSIYDTAAIDDFEINAGQQVTSVSMVLGGWNGYVGLEGIQGLSVNLYLSPEEAAVSLIGYATADAMGTPTGDPNWTGPHDLVHVDVELFCNPGTAYVALIPINEFGTNGQTGCGVSTLGDGNAWQANPGNGFGYGGLQSISDNLAYRVMGLAPDCNDNGIPDEDEIAADPSLDCNGNGWLDTCEIDAGYDCNFNGIVDACDIADGSSTDCDGNGVPDECDVDCNGNGIPDECDDITDCNGNGIFDECDVSDGTSYDCDDDLVPDECEIDCDGDGFIDDCDSEPDMDGNGVPDNCDPDCNDNGIADGVEILFGWADDCDGDVVPDDCQLADGSATDCDADGTLDHCQWADNPGLDCNENGILDACEIADGSVDDCNENGIPDSCDLADGGDADGDGYLDECECNADIAGPDGPLSDGVVDTYDLLAVIGYWGSSIPGGDINGDGIVGTDDLLAVIGAWGPCE